jgi:hypothetical protein
MLITNQRYIKMRILIKWLRAMYLRYHLTKVVLIFTNKSDNFQGDNHEEGLFHKFLKTNLREII